MEVNDSTSCPGRLTPGETNSDVFWLGGSVANRIGMGATGLVNKISCHLGNRTHAVQSVARRYTDCGIPARSEGGKLIVFLSGPACLYRHEPPLLHIIT